MRLAAGMLALLALEAYAAEGERTLLLPHPLKTGESVVIEVRVGTIARGQEIHVTTASGRELGVISPFGVKSGHAAGTYPIPVPRDAVVGQRLSIQVTVTGNGAPARAPTVQEVLSLRVVVVAPTASASREEEKKK